MRTAGRKPWIFFEFGSNDPERSPVATPHHPRFVKGPGEAYVPVGTSSSEPASLERPRSSYPLRVTLSRSAPDSHPACEPALESTARRGVSSLVLETA